METSRGSNRRTFLASYSEVLRPTWMYGGQSRPSSTPREEGLHPDYVMETSHGSNSRRFLASYSDVLASRLDVYGSQSRPSSTPREAGSKKSMQFQQQGQSKRRSRPNDCIQTMLWRLRMDPTAAGFFPAIPRSFVPPGGLYGGQSRPSSAPREAGSKNPCEVYITYIIGRLVSHKTFFLFKRETPAPKPCHAVQSLRSADSILSAMRVAWSTSALGVAVRSMSEAAPEPPSRSRRT